LILSCFNSLREICSGTRALLNGLQHAIVAQDDNRKPDSKGRLPETGADLLFR
jgi:hypothetical protein